MRSTGAKLISRRPAGEFGGKWLISGGCCSHLIYFVDRKFRGRSVRLSIGRFPTWTVQQAGERARELIVMMDMGIDPREKENKQTERGITLLIIP
ncbi:MAG: Arm DNA-binding domain-containing protein [Georgfuchsia sp.]